MLAVRSAPLPFPPRAGLSAGLALTALLTACSTYTPAPVDLATTARTFEAARLVTPRPGELNQAEALAVAVENATTVRKARAAYAVQVAAARTARVRPALNLNLTAEYSRQADPQHPWLYGGAVDVPLDPAAARSTRLETADLAVLRARYDVVEAVWTVRTALRKAVLDQAAAREDVAVAEERDAIRLRRLEILERRVAAGEDDRSLALQARTDRALSLQRLTAARAALAQADAALASALGLTVEACRDLVVTPGATASPDAATVFQARRDAATARADVLQAVIDYDTAEQGLRAAVAAQYPKITLSPGYTWERGVTKLPFSLGLALPPADLNRAAIAEAEARRVDAGRALEVAQAQVFSQTDAAAALLSAADAEAARLGDEDAAIARRGLRMSERSVALGALDRTDQLAAQASELDVRLALIDVARQRNAALADLEAATRRTDDPAETAVLAQAMAQLDTRP